MARQPTRRAELVLAAIVTLVALAAHGLAAWALPLGDDEGATLLERSLRALWTDHEALHHPPPFRLAVLVAVQVVDDVRALRLLSVLPASLAAGWLAWLVAASTPGLGGLVGGAIAGLGLALTPWSLQETSTLRPYGWVLLAGVWLLAALTSAMTRPERRSLHQLAIAAIAAAWTHFALLPWVALAALATLRVGTAGDVRDDTLGRRARLGALGLIAFGAAAPLLLAIAGALGKAGGGSATMTPWRALDLGYAPEPLLAALLATLPVLVGWRAPGDGRGHALRRLGLLAVPMLVGLLVAATLLQTLRWAHVAVLAPALWAGLGATIAAWIAAAAPRPRWRATAAASVALAWLAWGGGRAVAAWAEQPLWTDATALAAALDAADGGERRDVAVWTVASDGGHRSVRPGARAVLAARGLFRQGSDRCVGADVVHDDRCRRRARWTPDAPGCLGFCDADVCLWPVSDGPTPIDLDDDAALRDPDACQPAALRKDAHALLPTGGLLAAPVAEVAAAAGLDVGAYASRRIGRWWWLQRRR